MLQDTAPSRAHKHHGRLSARVGAALSELAALPGSSDALVARMALANVVENMGAANVAENVGTAEVADRFGPPTAVVTATGPKPRDGVPPRTVPLHVPPEGAAAVRRGNERPGRRDMGAAVRQPEAGYFLEAGARRRAEFHTRRDGRAAAGEAARHVSTAPSTGAPTGAWMA